MIWSNELEKMLAKIQHIVSNIFFLEVVRDFFGTFWSSRNAKLRSSARELSLSAEIEGVREAPHRFLTLIDAHKRSKMVLIGFISKTT